MPAGKQSRPPSFIPAVGWLAGLAAAACLLVMPVPGSGGTPADGPALPDQKEFLGRTFARIRAWEKVPPQPEYREHRITTEYDGDHPSSTLDELYRITWYRNQPLYVLEVKNGVPFPADNLRRQEVKRKAEIDEEIAHPSGKEKIQAIYLSPLLDRYRYQLEKREDLWGRSAIKVKFDPLSGKFPEKKIASKIMENITGFAWVDENEHELMRAEVWNPGPIRIGWGILGSINLLKIEYERRPRPDGIWFVSRLKIRVKVRVLFYTKYNLQVESEFKDLVFPARQPPENQARQENQPAPASGKNPGTAGGI